MRTQLNPNRTTLIIFQKLRGDIKTMSHNLTLGSLFDGSGGFPLGGLMCGIKPVWASEIELFPILVTTKRLPFMKHLGDINKINGADIEPVDIITFGSPCTDVSVAGKRAGLDGKQSSLFYQAIRIIKEMRYKTNEKYPRWSIWENVPGAFSSNKGEDFRCVLESMCKIKNENFSIPKPPKWSSAGEIVGDNFSLAWRTLDAQHWGVPQRRKRIYLVADFRGRSAGQILFESEGVSGYSAQSLRAWQRTAGSFTNSFRETSSLCLNDQGGNQMDVTEDITSTLRDTSHHPPCVLETAISVENHPSDSRITISDINTVQTLTAAMGTGGNNVPLIMSEIPKVYGICSKDSNSMKSNNPHSGFYETNTSRTLDKNGGNPSCNQGGVAVVTSIPFTQNQRDEVRILGNKSGSLNATANTKQQTFILQGSIIGRKDKNGPQGSGVNKDVSFTLNATDKHAVVYALARETFSCGQNFAPSLSITADGVNSTLTAQGPGAVATPIYSASKASFFTSAEKDLANTLVATDYKDPPIVNDTDELKYLVRRLTPTECARLQGFPDWWCSELETENPTVEDIAFWMDVFETHRKIMGTSLKSKTEKQIIKWLKNPHSDSAEYKMWGNGVALPCVYFVLSGIVFYSNKVKGEK